MPGAGEMRDRVTFQKRGPDENGDPLGPWIDRFSVAAQIVYLKGTEPVMAQRLQGVQPAVIVVREGANARMITTAWRAEDARTGVGYNITSVSPSKSRGFIDILAQSDGD